jgi:hypothetical protein
MVVEQDKWPLGMESTQEKKINISDWFWSNPGSKGKVDDGLSVKRSL